MPASPPRTSPPSLASLGWSARRTPPVQASVELVSSALWTVARTWSTATVLESVRLPRETTRVLIGVDGTGTLSLADGEVLVPPRHLVLLSGDVVVTSENTSLWAWMEWHLTSPAIRQERFAEHFSRALTIPAKNYSLLTTMTNVISTNEHFGRTGGASLLLEALAGVVGATVMDATNESAILSPSQASIVRRAQEIIERRHTDPDLDLSALAAELHVSVRHLTRAFSLAGTTVRQSIEARRLTTADALLAVNSGWNQADKDAIARAAGFSSDRHLRLARRRRG